MSSHKLFHTQKLSNGLTVSIYNHTKIYFGDYHHVRLKIICSLDNAAEVLKPYYADNIDFLLISYTRTLEKMGVPSVDIKSVTKALLNDFELTSLPYISSQDFPKKMIEKELSIKKFHARKYSGSVT